MMQSQLLCHGEEMRNGEGMRKRLKISVAHFDNSALIKTYSKTLIGRCMNPEEQETKALFSNLPKIWKLEERVTGTDLGFGKFQFDFQTEEELEAVLMQQPYHFDYWMLALARWQPKQSNSFPSEIMFWIRVIGVPLEFRMVPTFESNVGALERVVVVDVKYNRVQVVLDAFKELCLDLCHKEELCPLDDNNLKSSPERRRELREGNGAWTDGTKHEDRARSYKGVVINGQPGQQNKERDSRENYGKGKGKAVDVVDSKWVKVAEKGSRKPSTYYGSYRGDGEGFRYRNTRRDEERSGGTRGGVGEQEIRTRPSSNQPREFHYQRTPASAVREEGEIKGTGDDAATDEFQLELAKTQAEGSEAIIDTTEEEMGLLKLKGVMEQHEDIAADIDMEIEAIHASILENGGDVEVEEEFQTLSEEEAEQVAEVDGEEELVSGEVDSNNETVADDMAMRHSNRRRLLKPSTAGSNKMRMASSLLSPRKRAAAKVGTRQGDGGKLSERKGPSNPKSTNLKF
ncbi:uncharacterized protein LOC103874800 [Brassica rapa]|nr:uncharacterized protein LOC103874800 [Brassica rapa]